MAPTEATHQRPCRACQDMVSVISIGLPADAMAAICRRQTPWNSLPTDTHHGARPGRRIGAGAP